MLAQAFSFNYLARITRVWSHSKGFNKNTFLYLIFFEKVLRREGGEGGLVWCQGGVRLHKLPSALELCRTQPEASH